MVSDYLLDGATPDVVHSRFSADSWQKITAPVPKEIELTIYVEGEELLTILCTPTRLTHLVLGFLYSEGIITGKDDIASMRVCEDDQLADVRLSKPGYKPPPQRTLASGCGGGVSFISEGRKINSNIVIPPGSILSLMKRMNQRADLYRACGGVHTSALADAENILVIAEDIGRHNTLDKIMGQCLMTGLSTRDKLLLTTGRISSEMLGKASMMEAPIVISRSSPTDRSISLARELGITLVGYARGDRLSAYSHEERVEGALD
ncbi:MAG: formate dehydrogenase accessory sulfurtransferase FdhD [Dehalococcoidia bacterium]|nr:MAG: formate dehydrogenase accessory sulfurtransferase FdhD [Dehalococcoidia bacterium]UCG84650.1 MAG: formate dehydrogenase accessory sulfurtransferase FdhD [Dehalococcoidia bacterium]